MPYNGSLEHRVILQNALKEIDRRGHAISRLQKDLSNAILAGLVRGTAPSRTIGRTTLNKYMNFDFDKKDSKEIWSYSHAAAVFNFLETSETYKTSGLNMAALNVTDSDGSDFFISACRFFNTDNNISYSKIYGLEGVYAMFRPVWSSVRKDSFVRSIVTISMAGDALLYKEHQDYTDDRTQIHIEEDDSGFIIVYDRNVFALTKESNDKCMKFISLNEFSCALNGRTKVDIIHGNMTVLPHKTESLGYPFICRRIKDCDKVSRIVAFTDLDEQTRHYFREMHGLIGKKRETTEHS